MRGRTILSALLLPVLLANARPSFASDIKGFGDFESGDVISTLVLGAANLGIFHYYSNYYNGLKGEREHFPVGRWNQHFPFGQELEGFHARISRFTYDQLREREVNLVNSALATNLVFSGIELAEVRYLDSLGVSYQDMAANTFGILTGIVNDLVPFEVKLHYMHCLDFDNKSDPDKKWTHDCIPSQGERSVTELEILLKKYSFGFGIVIGGPNSELNIGESVNRIPYTSNESNEYYGFIEERNDGYSLHASVGYDFYEGEPSIATGFKIDVGDINIQAEWGLKFEDSDVSGGVGAGISF